MQCPKCGAEAGEKARFCETCGASLAAEQAGIPTGGVTGSCRCGAKLEQTDAQGFCLQCGRRVQTPARPPQARDHLEIEQTPAFAGVTDRGRRHSRNEDALALALGALEGQDAYILVVCDGVSSSQAADQASEAAAQTAKTLLTEALQTGGMNFAEAMNKAIAAAHQAVCAVPHLPDKQRDPPLTTIVAALVHRNMVTIGWVGDSRAYLLTDHETRLLTHDHSWLNEVVDTGVMSLEEAESAPQAHAITLCLGLWEDGTPEESPLPGLLAVPAPPGSRLLLCTDGLWNYAPTLDSLAALVAETDAPETALELTRRLTAFANLQGGRDNITTAVLTL